jgi:metal-sulfur cluster biosynthetic enzyme
MSAATLRPQVEEALGTVLDPCSVFNGTRLSIVELGMVDEVKVEESGDVFVRLFLDDPTCIFFFEINRLMKEAVEKVDGVGEIEVEIKADEVWTEDRMKPRAKERLEQIRATRRKLSDEQGAAAGWPLPMVDPDPQPQSLPLVKGGQR